MVLRSAIAWSRLRFWLSAHVLLKKKKTNNKQTNNLPNNNNKNPKIYFLSGYQECYFSPPCLNKACWQTRTWQFQKCIACADTHTEWRRFRKVFVNCHFSTAASKMQSKFYFSSVDLNRTWCLYMLRKVWVANSSILCSIEVWKCWQIPEEFIKSDV